MQSHFPPYTYSDIDNEDILLMQQLRIPAPHKPDYSPQSPWEYYQACFEQIFNKDKQGQDKQP